MNGDTANKQDDSSSGMPSITDVVQAQNSQGRANAASGNPDDRRNLRMSCYESWSLIITGLGVIVGIVVVIIYGLQLKAMRQQLREMQSSSSDTRILAQAAKNQADVTRQYLIGTQAAILDFGANLEVSGLFIGLSNNGHVIATEVHAEWEVAIASNPESIKERQSFTADVPQIAPGGTFQRLDTLSATTPQQLNTIRQSTDKETIVLSAKWSYDNGFGERVEKSSCKAWLAFPWVKNEAGGLFRANGWADCSDYTRAINNLRKAERAEPPK